MKPIAHRRAVNVNLVNLLKLQPKLIQRQFAPLRKARANPILQSPQFARTAQMTLTLRRKTARLATKLDHVIDEFRRYPKMPRRFAMTMTFVNKCDDPLP